MSHNFPKLNRRPPDPPGQFYGIAIRDGERAGLCLDRHPCESSSRYSTRDGTCNNPLFPDMGVVGTALQPTAFLSSHPDGISPVSGPEFLQSGPSARTVSQELFVRDSNPGKKFSLLFPYILKTFIEDVYREVFIPGKKILLTCPPAQRSAYPSRMSFSKDRRCWIAATWMVCS